MMRLCSQPRLAWLLACVLLLSLSGPASATANHHHDASNEGDGGRTSASPTLTYEAPTEVSVDADYTDETPGWGYDHFALLAEGVSAVAEGGLVNVAPRIYHEPQVRITRSMRVMCSAHCILTGGMTPDLPVPGLVSITAAGDVTFQGFNVQMAGPSNGVHAAVYVSSPAAGVTYTITNNDLMGIGDSETSEDYGLLAQGGLETLVFQHNTITATGGNPILIEKHPGATDVSYNTIDRASAAGAADAYFNMNYGGAGVTTLQKVSHNTIDMGGWGPFDYASRGSAITFAGNYTGDAGPGGYTNLQVSDNTIVNLKPYRRGITLWNNAGGDGSTGDIANAVISGNSITASEVVSNTGVIGPGGEGSAGIRLLGRATNPLIHDNTVNGPEYVFRGLPWNGHIATGAHVNHNNFSNSTLGFEWQGPDALDAEENWWGAGCGGTGGIPVAGSVDYDPWWLQSGGPALGSSGRPGGYEIPAGATAAEVQALLDCVPPGAVVTFQEADYPGGYAIDTNGLQVNVSGATFGHGSPAFTINAGDVVIQGPGTLDGQGSADPAILVNAGADNFTLRDMTITGWRDGIELAGSVASFKLFGNFIHANSRDGLHVDAGAAVDGVINIDGNLFKNNAGAGVNNAGSTPNLNVQYNSWGDLAGPSGPHGDGAAGSVDASNFTFVEPFFDMVPDTLASTASVVEGKSFDAVLKIDAAKLYGFTFAFTYDTSYLTLNSTTFAGPWSGRCTSLSSTPGVVSYRCQLLDPMPAVDVTAGTVATFSFTTAGGAGNGPWSTYLDISHLLAETSAAAVGGSKVFVNNAGSGAPSAASRDITDADDGAVSIVGIAQYKGYVDLQGRTTDSGATVKVWNQAQKSGATQLAQSTSVGSGAYTTSYVPPQVMTVGATYWLIVDRRLFLATTPSAAASYSHSALLSTRPATSLANVRLLGGDATDDEMIDVNDATCIGGNYSAPPVVCGVTGTSDVNEDGSVDILDLSLMGGNYSKTSSSWTP